MNATHDRPPVAERIAHGRSLRDEGIAQVENNADPRVILAIDAAIERAIAAGREFSANDIRDEFPVSDEHLVGARVRAAGVRKVDGRPVLKAVGYVPSSLPSTHGHPIRLWRSFDAWEAGQQEQGW